MSINLETILALLLLSIVGGIPPAVGQNALSDTTGSDIIDLVGNVTERGGAAETEEQQQQEEGGAAETEEEQQRGATAGEGAAETEDLGSSTSVSDADDDTSSVTAGGSIMVNEIELNPSGNDVEGGDWIELYNPTDADINISHFEITPSFQSPTIELPPDAVIEAGETYVIELDRPMLSNTGESLVIANATGDIQDRTPSLVDRSDDDRTWQRIPDGNNEWQFVENTQGNSNDEDPDTLSTIPDSEENTQGNANDDPDTLSTILDSVYSGSDVECLGSADCIEGVASRIVDGDTLYVRANSTVYKVDLALIEAPSRTEEMFVESTAFTRDLCLGSTVLVDQDDMLLTSNSGVIGVVYCSSSNLNSELLNNGYAELETEQCATSEFADEPWVKDYGC